MSGERSWEGNWRIRLHERVHERGYTSLTAFAEARPTVSLVALAKELGEDDVAGVQVLSELPECLPHGWPAVLDDANRFKVAKALGSWIADTPETHKERARQVRTALLATPPPPCWRPLGPDDELLRTLLPDEGV